VIISISAGWRATAGDSARKGVRAGYNEWGGRLGSVAVGAASRPGFTSRGAACTLAILGAGPDARKSLEVSSYRLSDSGISLQMRPKASEKTRRMQNLPSNRIGNEPFLANPTLKLRHDLALQYSA